MRLLRCRPSSLGLGESHPVVVPVEDGVVLTNKDVSKDPQGAGGGGNVQRHETAQTNGLSGLRNLFDWRETRVRNGAATRKRKTKPEPKQSCSVSF